MAVKKKTTTGDLIDSLYEQDQVIHTLEKQVRDAKAVRDGIEKRLLAKFGASKLNGARGLHGTAYVKTSQYPSIESRPKFLKYVITNKAWDLFQNRITAKEYFDRVEDGEFIPGVKVFPRTRVSVTKSK